MNAMKNMGKAKWIGIAVLLAGIVCAAAGAIMGQYDDVLRKAIFICMECIGIG